MIDLDFLQSLIRAIDESSLDSLEIERGGTRVRLSKTPQGTVQHVAAAPAAPVAPAPDRPPEAGGAAASPSGPVSGTPSDAGSARSDLLEIKSPMVGTFYRAPAPDAPPYVEVGGRIATGDTLCIIEAMKLMNELEAEISGTIEEVLVDDGEPVEFGQVLFRVAPA